MSEIQNRAWTPRKGAFKSKSRSLDKNSEWTTSSLIKKANSHVSLLSVLKEYNIKIIPNGKDDWSKTLNCPFPDHKDTTPSFGYNYKTDTYNCFVCGKGRAVEFLAKKSNEPIRKVAVFLLNNINIDPYKEETKSDNDFQAINLKIIEFSQFLAGKFQKHKNNNTVLELFEKLVWYFDNFIEKNFDKADFSIRSLGSEIERIKELIEQIEEKIL